jgi:hypothetical protein
MKHRRDRAHWHKPPIDKAAPEQQVRAAEQQVDTGHEAMPEPFWVSRSHTDQQQADQERQPMGFQEADGEVRTGEDAPPRPDPEKVAQQLEDHLRAADQRQKGAIGTHERFALFVEGFSIGFRLRMGSYHSSCSFFFQSAWHAAEMSAHTRRVASRPREPASSRFP